MAFFSHTYDVLRREVTRIGRQPMYLLLLLVLPLAAFGFFTLLFEKGVARNMPIAVVDQDRTPLSRTVIRMIDETPSALVAYEAGDMTEGERLIRTGQANAVVLIPPHFEKDILSNRQTHLENYISGTNMTVNGLLSKDIQTAVTTFSGGIQIQLLTKQGLTERQAMAQLMPVRFDRHVLFNPYTNYGYYLAPSFMPMMLLIFTMLATIFSIGTELKNSTAREWLDTAGGSPTAALVGKLLPTTVILSLMSMLMLVVIVRVVGVPLNGSAALLLGAGVLFVLSYQAIAVLIVTLLSNLRLSLSIGGGYSVLAFTFSGLTFPIMAMYPVMQYASKIFPFTYYTNIFIDQLLRGAPAAVSVPDLCWMALFLVLPILCLPRLKRICTEEKFWGRL